MEIIFNMLSGLTDFKISISNDHGKVATLFAECWYNIKNLQLLILGNLSLRLQTFFKIFLS